MVFCANLRSEQQINLSLEVFQDVEGIHNLDQAALINKERKLGGFVAVAADLTTAQGISAVVSAARAAVGDYRELWAIVNNAGICLPGNVEWADPSTYQKTFDVNFFAPVTGCC